MPSISIKILYKIIIVALFIVVALIFIPPMLGFNIFNYIGLGESPVNTYYNYDKAPEFDLESIRSFDFSGFIYSDYIEDTDSALRERKIAFDCTGCSECSSDKCNHCSTCDIELEDDELDTTFDNCVDCNKNSRGEWECGACDYGRYKLFSNIDYCIYGYPGDNEGCVVTEFYTDNFDYNKLLNVLREYKPKTIYNEVGEDTKERICDLEFPNEMNVVNIDETVPPGTSLVKKWHSENTEPISLVCLISPDQEAESIMLFAGGSLTYSDFINGKAKVFGRSIRIKNANNLKQYQKLIVNMKPSSHQKGLKSIETLLIYTTNEDREQNDYKYSVLILEEKDVTDSSKFYLLPTINLDYQIAALGDNDIIIHGICFAETYECSGTFGIGEKVNILSAGSVYATLYNVVPYQDTYNMRYVSCGLKGDYEKTAITSLLHTNNWVYTNNIYSLSKGDKVNVKITLNNFDILSKKYPNDPKCRFSLNICAQKPFAQSEDDKIFEIYQTIRSFDPSKNYKEISLFGEDKKYYIYNEMIFDEMNKTPEEIAEAIKAGYNEWISTVLPPYLYYGITPWLATSYVSDIPIENRGSLENEISVNDLYQSGCSPDYRPSYENGIYHYCPGGTCDGHIKMRIGFVYSQIKDGESVNENNAYANSIKPIITFCSEY